LLLATLVLGLICGFFCSSGNQCLTPIVGLDCTAVQ
jgi:hypothetical protein